MTDNSGKQQFQSVFPSVFSYYRTSHKFHFTRHPLAYSPCLNYLYDPTSPCYRYRSGDGSARDEVGTPRAAGPEGPAVTVQGSYSYASPSGPIQVSYVADENGYQPTGNNIHPAIIKAVAQQVMIYWLIDNSNWKQDGIARWFGAYTIVGRMVTIL